MCLSRTTLSSFLMGELLNRPIGCTPTSTGRRPIEVDSQVLRRTVKMGGSPIGVN